MILLHQKALSNVRVTRSSRFHMWCPSAPEYRQLLKNSCHEPRAYQKLSCGWAGQSISAARTFSCSLHQSRANTSRLVKQSNSPHPGTTISMCMKNLNIGQCWILAHEKHSYLCSSLCPSDITSQIIFQQFSMDSCKMVVVHAELQCSSSPPCTRKIQWPWDYVTLSKTPK